MAMKNAISMVFSESWHDLCTFHIMQNVVKHLSRMVLEKKIQEII
jgi:transposase-like protein